MSKKIKVLVRDKNTLVLAEAASAGDIIDLTEINKFDSSAIEAAIEAGKDQVFARRMQELKQLMNLEKNQEVDKLNAQINLLKNQQEADLKSLANDVENKYKDEINKLKNDILLINNQQDAKIKEIKADNYLFGHLYGAILPLCNLLFNLFSISLICYRKRLFAFFRKRMFEQYNEEFSTVLSFVLIYSVFFFVCTFSLHKSYLAIWSLQTSSSFMGLTKASSVFMLLGFPYKILTDILYEKNRSRECNLSILSGVIFSAIVAAICHKFLGAGSTLYVLSIAFGMFVTVLLFGWFMWNDIGLSYLVVLKKSYRAIILNVFLCVILVILESLIFTAFGGLGTLVICLLFSYLFLRVGLFLLRIFTKEERQLLAFKANIKAILGISR